VEGRISFYPQSRTLAGSYDMVYLNRGTLDGVETGTPLTVYRIGHDAREQVRDTMVRVGDREIAQLVVVYAHDEASVALVRAAEEELVLGDVFRGAAN
jgi:hypothetical protein